MPRLPLQSLRSLVLWDRNPWIALLLRAGTLMLLLRPWALQIHRVPLRLEEIDPAILETARAAGVDPANPACWPSLAGTLARALVAPLVFVLLWWGLSRLRHWIMRRSGLGSLAVGCLLAAYVAWIAGCQPLLRAVMVPGSHLHTGVPVWQAWVIHPFVHPGTMEGFLQLLALAAFLGVELILLVAEGRLLLAEAKEGALRSRLSPHFLFNALNTLEAQIEADPRGALDTTQRLASLFEQVQRVSERPTVPLRDELALVEDLLALERRRLGARLAVTIDVPEEILDRELPVLGLQVLVENAIRHAIAPRVEGGTLAIRAEAFKEGLWIAVEDSGDGQSKGRPGAGRALSNLRARLRRPSDLVLEPCELGFRAAFRWS